VAPGTQTLFWSWLVEYAIQYSIYQSSKELLFTPTTPEVKFQAKMLIDTFLFRLGVAVGAIWVLVFLQHSEMSLISLNIVLLSLPTLGVAVALHRCFTALTSEATREG
jgi:ATP/ADP translocase